MHSAYRTQTLAHMCTVPIYIHTYKPKRIKENVVYCVCVGKQVKLRRTQKYKRIYDYITHAHTHTHI